jgi:hypothetical protein
MVRRSSPVSPTNRLATGSPAVPPEYRSSMIAEQKRTLHDKMQTLDKQFGGTTGSSASAVAHEAKLRCLLLHLAHVCKGYADGMRLIELMLWREVLSTLPPTRTDSSRQLVAVVGHEVSLSDLRAFQHHHLERLLKEGYRPRPLCYAVRRPEHDPEGRQLGPSIFP